MNKIKLSALFLSILILLVLIPLPKVHAATSPSLGQADSFAVLAGEDITNVPTSAITGNVGLYAGTGAAIGLTCTEVNGTIYDRDGLYTGGGGGITTCRVTDDGLLLKAKNDLGTAFTALAAGANADVNCIDGSGNSNVILTSGTNLATLGSTPGTLGSGVYCSAGSFLLTNAREGSDLILTGGGPWVFRTVSALTISSGASVTGSDPCNVWWQVGSSATLDTTSSVIGNILASTSISMNTGATLTGRALASTGSVTLQSNTITNATCLTTSSSSSENTFNKDTRCLDTTPASPQWASRSSANGGVNLSWSVMGGTLVDIEITNDKGEYVYKYVKVPNTGHMFLPNVTLSQLIRIRVFNECEYGDWLVVSSTPGLPNAGFAPHNNNTPWYIPASLPLLQKLISLM